MQSPATLTHEEGVWVIRVVNHDGGKTQEYRCSTEGQARALMSVLTPTNPSAGPPRRAARTAVDVEV